MNAADACRSCGQLALVRHMVLGLCDACAKDAAALMAARALEEAQASERLDRAVRAAGLDHFAARCRRAIDLADQQGQRDGINVTISGSREVISLLARLAQAQAAQDRPIYDDPETDTSVDERGEVHRG